MEEKNIVFSDNEGRGADVPKEQRHLNTTSYDYSTKYLYDLMKSGKIILEVPFQRNQIWKTDRSSALIESIIMNVPIPPLYFAEDDNGKWLVLDGLQRLLSIKNYFDNEFGLTKLEVYSELNKRKLKDLPLKARTLLEDGLFRINVIKNDSHKDIKYDVFMRLNKGSATLNYQELRNCMYRGNLNDAAKELCTENKDFLTILKQKKPHIRFLDVEMVLRFFAISDAIWRADKGEYENRIAVRDYGGRMVQFINNYMNEHKNCSDEAKQEYKNRFNDTLEKVKIVFGTDKAFRDVNSESKKVYTSIFDFIMASFERMTLDFIKSNKQDIYKKYVEYLKRDDIKESLSLRTTDTVVVNTRIREWFEVWNNVIHV